MRIWKKKRTNKIEFTEVEQLRGQLSLVEQAGEKFKRQFVAVKGERDQARAKIREMQGSADTLREVAEKERRARADAEADARRRNELLTKALDERDTLRRRMEELRRQLDDAEKEQKRLREAAEGWAKGSGHWYAEHEALKKKYDRLVVEKEALRRESEEQILDFSERAQQIRQEMFDWAIALLRSYRHTHAVDLLLEEGVPSEPAGRR